MVDLRYQPLARDSDHGIACPRRIGTGGVDRHAPGFRHGWRTPRGRIGDAGRGHAATPCDPAGGPSATAHRQPARLAGRWATWSRGITIMTPMSGALDWLPGGDVAGQTGARGSGVPGGGAG